MAAPAPAGALAVMRRATAKRQAADRAWRAAVVAAVEAGESTRVVGAAAGVSHARVVQIVNEERRG